MPLSRKARIKRRPSFTRGDTGQDENTGPDHRTHANHGDVKQVQIAAEHYLMARALHR